MRARDPQGGTACREASAVNRAVERSIMEEGFTLLAGIGYSLSRAERGRVESWLSKPTDEEPA